MNGTLNVLYTGHQRGLWTDSYTYCRLLQDCVYEKKVAEGKGLHARMIKDAFEPDIFLNTKLVIFYAKCGNLEDAGQLFDKMPKRNSVSWNALLAEYCWRGLEEEVLSLFAQMGEAIMTPDEFSLGSVLKVCSRLVALELGKQVHAYIIRSGFGFNVVLMTALVDMYEKCKCIKDARRVFDEISLRDLVSWTAIIAGYVEQGNCKEALNLFCKMPWFGIKPNKVTFRTASGFVSDVVLGSALVDMYAKCGSIKEARQVFDFISPRDVVLWTVIVTAYGKHGFGKEVLQLFEEMN